MGRYYEPEYYAFQSPQGVSGRIREWRRRQWVRWLGSLVDGVEGDVLELGCGTGDILESLAERCGRACHGLEFSDVAVRLARERCRYCRVTQGDAQHDTLPGGDCALVYLFFLIEHLHRPLVVLDKLAGRLRVGGHLVISTPDNTSWAARISGRYWDADVPRHLQFFGRRHLEAQLRARGLRIISIRYDANPNNWIWGLRQFGLQRGWRRGTLARITPDNLLLLMPAMLANLPFLLVRQSARMLVVARKER